MFTVIHGLRWQYNYADQRLKSSIKVIVSFGGCLIIVSVLSYIYVCYTALGENPIYTREWRLLANVLVFS